MALFGPPSAGWSVSDDSLTALAPRQAYGLGGHGDFESTVPITFTAEDLAALGVGEVLVGKVNSNHERVTEEEFRKRAEDSC